MAGDYALPVEDAMTRCERCGEPASESHSALVGFPVCTDHGPEWPGEAEQMRADRAARESEGLCGCGHARAEHHWIPGAPNWKRPPCMRKGCFCAEWSGKVEP